MDKMEAKDQKRNSELINFSLGFFGWFVLGSLLIWLSEPFVRTCASISEALGWFCLLGSIIFYPLINIFSLIILFVKRQKAAFGMILAIIVNFLVLVIQHIMNITTFNFIQIFFPFFVESILF